MAETVPTITTERLVLRPLAASDVAAYADMHADEEVARYLTSNGAALSAEDAWRQLAMFIGHWELRGFGMWAIAELERPDVLIGRVGAHEPEGWPDVEIGWVLARSAWGRGYATEAARAALRYVFEVLNRPRAVSLIHPDNVRSRAVAARLGQRYAGEWTFGTQRADLYEIDVATWRANATFP